jgi:hypothetical protein
VATKIFFPMGPGPNDRGLSRKHILAGIDPLADELYDDDDFEVVDVVRAVAAVDVTWVRTRWPAWRPPTAPTRSSATTDHQTSAD